MSSFVISKKEYIKAAGVVAGIAEAKRDFWIYNYEKGRKYTEADYYDTFSEFFTLNALSVQMQYGDKIAAEDPAEYKKEFKAAVNLGKQLVYAGNKAVNDAAVELNDLFRSAIYQTEYEPYMWKMSMFFDRVISEIFESVNPHECRSWGSIEIDPPATRYQAII